MFENFLDPLPKKILAEGNSCQPPRNSFVKQDILEGKTIGDGDRYLLQALLGVGGMSRVYQALDTKLENRTVAIKLMSNYSTYNDLHLKRFMGEIRAISRLRHPNIVQIFDFGVTPTTGPFNGAPFYVMEHLEGKTLQNLLSENKKLPLDSILNIVNQVCAALKESHQKGIIHRDLKPDNIFLVSDGAFGAVVKILDFGIAKNISIDSHNHTKLTQEGCFIGTYRYASPEQCRGLAEIDQRTDIYSLGIILYEAICGKNPYSSNNNSDTSQADWIAYHIRVPPKSLKEQPGCENIPDEIEHIVTKCLAKSSQARFSNIEELQNAFANSLSVRREKNCDFFDPWNAIGGVKVATKSKQSTLKVVLDEKKNSLSLIDSSALSEDFESGYTSIPVPINKSRLLVSAGIISVLVSIFAGNSYINHKQFVSQAREAVEEIKELQATADYRECIQQAETFSQDYPQDLQTEVKTLLSECYRQDETERQLAENRKQTELATERQQLAEDRKQAELATERQQLAENRKQAELNSDRGIDYTLLRNYLEAGKWKEADIETKKVMLEASGGNLTSESIRNFSCNDLETINSLWLNYSNGRFGFSVQNQEYQKAKPYLNSLGDKLGWRQGDWIHYDYLSPNFNLNVPTGHLPAYVFRHFYQGEERWSTQTRITGILDRTNNCNL